MGCGVWELLYTHANDTRKTNVNALHQSKHLDNFFRPTFSSNCEKETPRLLATKHATLSWTAEHARACVHWLIHTSQSFLKNQKHTRLSRIFICPNIESILKEPSQTFIANHLSRGYIGNLSSPLWLPSTSIRVMLAEPLHLSV